MQRPGRRLSEWVLIFANIILAAFAIFAFCLSLYQNRIFNRPRLNLSVETQNVDIEAVNATNTNGDITTSSPKIGLSIQNYGNLPAFFEANLEGWPGKVAPFQNSKNYISPGQKVDLRWHLYWPIGRNDICSWYDKLKLKIVYGQESNDFDYVISLKSEWIDDPRVNRESREFNAMLIGCESHLEGSRYKVMVWMVEKAD